MNPAGHDLHHIPMFMDMMWRGGGPFRARMAPPAYNGEWSGYNQEMKHFAMDRHNGGIQGVFMDHSVQWHRAYDQAYTPSWPRWMAGYPGH